MSMVSARRFVLALLCCGSVQGAAQSYPSKPVRLIVPFAPGGTTEVLARIIAQSMGEHLGQQLVTDNRPGAAGSLGTTLATKAAPDGYTLLLTSLSPIVINVSMFGGKPPYDSTRDLAPVSLITRVPSVLTAHPGIVQRDLRELIAHAKANPGKLTYGSAGAGSSNHLIGELLKLSAGIDMLHIPYKGAGPAAIALLSKEVDLIMAAPPAIMSQVRAGQLRPIAVSGAKRSPTLPEVPTMAEAGVPGFDATGWYCMLVPAGTPRAIIDQVRRALLRALDTAAVRERLLAEGAAPESSTPEYLASLIAAEIPRWAKAVQVSGAKLQ